MARRLSGRLALVGLVAISGCSVEETPERCLERFEALLGNEAVSGPDPGQARFQPVFTYDMTDTDGGLEALFGEGAAAEGARVTIAQGALGPALDAFDKTEVPPNGAFLAADGVALFRVRGKTPGSRRETLEAGCREAPAKARLTQVRWLALQSGPQDRAGSR